MKYAFFPPASQRCRRTLFSAIIGGAILGTCRANVSLPDIFSDHMVLQKTEQVPVWGKASPEETISVEVGGQSAQAKAGADGKWRAILNLSQSAPGPFEMMVKGSNTLVVKDVVVGEVWLASGQSNMRVPVNESANSAPVIAASANLLLREFIVAAKPSPTMIEEANGKWYVAGPDKTGHFSAISYFFGKQVQKELGVPVGMINSAVGGTYNESWMSPQALAADPDLSALQKVAAETAAKYPQALKDYAAQVVAWEQQHGRADQPKGNPGDFSAPSASVADWKTIKLPGGFHGQGLPDAGVTWLRKKIAVPAAVVGRPIRLDMGGIHDFTTVYWNGVKVAETTPATPPGGEGKFSYTIPAAEVKEGETVLAVRVFSPQGSASLSAAESGSNFRAISGSWVTFLAGDWLAKAEYELPPLDGVASQSQPVEPPLPQLEKNIPGYLYNGMIYPLIPYAIRGFIWYQGEGNTEYAAQYRHLFPALINDWRAQWKHADLPFYWCQIAGFGPRVSTPADSRWAEVREVQNLTTKLPHTGEAILIDIGEEKDIHPRNKKDAGERLSKVALANTYGKSIVANGPTFQSMKIEGGKIRLQFDHSDGGLVARPLPEKYQPRSIETVTAPLVRNSPQSQLEGFAICGSDHQWKWADAKIEGKEVVVSSPQVSTPIAVRYAWADNPIVNLYNGAGLPAVPFRTDDLPGISNSKRTR